MYRHAVAPGAATADRRVKSADARQINQSDHRLADDRIGNRDAPQGKAAKEIVGPVDRIDNPAALARPSPALLPEKTILRKGLGQPGADQRLYLAVGDADKVLRPLRLACQGLATRKISSCEIQPRGSDGWRPLGGHGSSWL